MVAHALIFDLDGTVWDSAGWFASALAADNPAELSLIRNDLIEGCNITALIRKSNITRVRLLREAQRRNGAPPVFDGMREAIQQLIERGIPLAVVTSLPGTLAVPMLEACDLATSFPVVVHAGMCRVPKPHPASILKGPSAAQLQSVRQGVLCGGPSDRCNGGGTRWNQRRVDAARL